MYLYTLWFRNKSKVGDHTLTMPWNEKSGDNFCLFWRSQYILPITEIDQTEN